MNISANDRHVLQEVSRCCGRMSRALPPTMSYNVLEHHEDTQDALRFNVQRIVALLRTELSAEGIAALDIPQLRRIQTLQEVSTPFDPISMQNLWTIVRYDLSEVQAALFIILDETV